MRIVVLGTGTSVGKTYVTATLAAALRTESPLALKPIETGVTPQEAGDAGTIARAAGHEPRLSRWRFGRPVSPHLVARESGRPIELNDVKAWVDEEERRVAARVVLVETAGGSFSPLAPSVTNVDLALALEPALWLLVAPDSLGVLHDVSATLRALPRAPDALVLSAARAPDQSTGSNARELGALKIAQVLAVLEPGAGECAALAAWVRTKLALTPGG